MLKKVDLSVTMDKDNAKSRLDELSKRLSYLQRSLREAKIPVIIVFEGFGASGKGTMINELIKPLDPRGFTVYSIKRSNKEENKRPYFCRFFSKLPAKGRITILDRSWYRRVLNDRLDKITTKEQLECAYDEINNFEKLLTDDGMVIIKLFLYISKQEQKKRFKKLSRCKATAWRVTKRDIRQNKHYKEYRLMNDEMLENTDTDKAPWTIIEATDYHYARYKIMSTVVERLEEAIDMYKIYENDKEQESHNTQNIDNTMLDCDIDVNTTSITSDDRANVRTKVLAGIDLRKEISKEEYKKKIKDLEKRLQYLQSVMRLKRVPVIIAFEGWDAAGKGGAIKRITSKLDPRSYEVIPISSPNDIERAHHYLWRFYQTFPRAGHLTIYDRTWYGRVLVERVEGFCSVKEWRRAYHEINEMEEQLTNSGAIIIKFWLHIDKEEQERRFLARQNNPDKVWKITEEDWRNRAKWEQYEEAVDEMIIKTSTTYAPWVVVEGNCKRYARIKVLETIVDELEKRI